MAMASRGGWHPTSPASSVTGTDRPLSVCFDLARRGTKPLCTPGGPQQVTVVDESGLYRLILRSNQEGALEFQDWVTGEVLPAIRRTGSYSVPNVAPVALNLRDPLQVTQALAQALEIVGELQAANAQALVRIEVLAPKAEQADQHRAADGLRSIRDWANEVSAWAKRVHGAKVLQQDVFDFLAEIKILIRGETIRHNQPTKSALDRGFVMVKVGERPSKSAPRGVKATATARLTPAGEGWAWDRAVKRIAATGSLRMPTAVAVQGPTP
jgi:anti-repressor protein